MSDVEVTDPVSESTEASTIDNDNEKTEIESPPEEQEEEVKTSEEEKPDESDNTSLAKIEEPDKKSSEVEVTPTKSASASDENKPGECNLLPVLVERLRSALELSCSSRSSEDPLPLEDSGVDSEEDLRMWASGLCHSIEQSHDQTHHSPKPVDLKFLEDLLLSDIQTALSRLQDTLKRVDVNALTKYSATLDSTNKLNLLRLISNLLVKLKIPEEVVAKPSDNATSKPQLASSKRRRANRHTIAVSAEEIARARRLVEENPINSTVLPDSSGPTTSNESSFHGEKQVESTETAQPVAVSSVQPQIDKPFEQVRDKHTKDAINQQQTYLNKSKEFLRNDKSYHQLPLTEAVLQSGTNNRLENNACNNDNTNVSEDYNEDSNSTYYQQPGIPARYNKFVSKKSKIKRANTIDIPNYLKLQAENFDHNQSVSLRRPIEVGDRNVTSTTNVIPAFKPKTENDRKFLALINKNNDKASSNNTLPYKSFNYKHPANVDKNWNNRFSNIKTTFDKQTSQLNSPEETNIRSQVDFSRRSQSGTNSDSGESEGVVVGSLRLPYAAPPKPKPGGFTHAPTSPFQKIEKPTNRNETTSIFKSGYLPKGGSSLQAKVKMFNQETPNPPSIVSQHKNKFGKMSNPPHYGNVTNIQPNKLNVNGNFNHNTTYNQNNFTTNEVKTTDANNVLRSYLPGNRNVVSSKLIVNAKVSNEEQQAQVKAQQPVSTQRTKVDKTQANNDENNVTFNNPHYYPDKLYNSYVKAQSNNDAAPRTSSHSFMLKKIADENNVETKPKINRYSQDAAMEKGDNARDSRGIHPSVFRKYDKPAEDYSQSNSQFQCLDVKNLANTPSGIGYNASSIYDSNKAPSQQYRNEKPPVEYTSFQNYSSNDGTLRRRSVTDNSNFTEDTKIPANNAFLPSESFNLPQNFPMQQNFQTSNNFQTPQSHQTSKNFQPPTQNLQTSRNLRAPQNFQTSQNFHTAQNFQASQNFQAPQNFQASQNFQVPQNFSVSQNLSTPYEKSYANRPIPQESTAISVSEINQIPIIPPMESSATYNYEDSHFVPYQSYQARKDSISNIGMHGSRPVSNYYYDKVKSNEDYEVRCDEQRFPDSSTYKVPQQSQSVQYNVDPELNYLQEVVSQYPSEASHFDREVQTYVPQPATDLERAATTVYRERSSPCILSDDNIQNQDISSDGIVTRYQCAIATVETTPESSEPDMANETSSSNARVYNFKLSAYPTAPRDETGPIQEDAKCNRYENQSKPRSVIEVTREDSANANAFDEIQRHNLLQQQIIQKMQGDGNSGKDGRRQAFEKFQWKEKLGVEGEKKANFDKSKNEIRLSSSPTTQFPLNKSNSPKPSCFEEPVIESNNTLEKIHLFEGKSSSFANRQFRPLSIPKFDKLKEFSAPKINVVNPSKAVPAIIANKLATSQAESSIINSSTNMIDSSDEYLMSCANRQSRSIVLSKSESWHQLALTRGNNLQPPQPKTNVLLKPPKPKSPASLRLSKQYEAPTSSDSMKRMEEKIQRYFHSPTNVPPVNVNTNESTTASTTSVKRESKSKRQFSSKKNPTTGLVRSHTMPHLYDEKLLDENTDVEKAFDSLFQEATKFDNRY